MVGDGKGTAVFCFRFCTGHRRMQKMVPVPITKVREISVEEKLYRTAVELRHKLFFAEFELPIDVTCDQLEDSSSHYAITNQSELIAYSRLTEINDSEFKISQIAWAFLEMSNFRFCWLN